jgi:hypothetical protein
VFRQFGLKQHIPKKGIPFSQVILTPFLIGKIEQNLQSVEKADSMCSRSKSFLLTASYRAWITGKVGAKENARNTAREVQLKITRKESKKRLREA